MVRTLYLQYFAKHDRVNGPIQHFNTAVGHAKVNDCSYYNVGLGYFNFCQLDEALAQAWHAVALGSHRTQLLNLLKEANKWREPENRVLPMTILPKISVVIPCFNAERYITATIRSAMAQDWPDMEIVVVDDGSSDRSVELVRQNFPQVRMIQQPNQGVAAARNTGIAHATADWIAFLDADDIWLPGKLHAQWAQLIDDKNTRMSYTAWRVWTSNDPAPSGEYLDSLQHQANDTARWTGPTGWVYPQLLIDCVVWTSTVLAHRSVFAEVGQFDPSLRIGEDYDLWLRASRVTKILRVSAPFALYRIHAESITKSVPEKNFRAQVVGNAIARWGYAAPDGSTARKADVNRALAKSWSDYAGSHIARGNTRQALQAGFASLRADLWHTSAWKVLLKTIGQSLS